MTRRDVTFFGLLFALAIAVLWIGVRASGTSSSSAAPVGFGGASLLGCENTGARSKACEFQIDPATIPAGTTAAIWGLPVPAPVTGEQLQLFVTMNQGALDGCAGPQCNGWTTRRLICTWGTGTCLDASLDASDFRIDGQLPTILADASASVGADAGAGTITLSALCPAGGPACSIGGSVSVNRILPPPVSSSSSGGSSSGGSSSSSSSSGGSSSGGPSPSILSITPLATTSAGGWVHQIKVASGTCTGTPSATFAGVAATSVTCTTTSNMQATSPAFSTPNGSGTEQVLTVTAGGTTFTSASFSVSGAVSAAGAIKLTTSVNNFVTGATVTVANVGGTVEANGTWPITVVDTTHFTLTGSSFVNAYTSGGTAGQGIFELPSNTVITAYYEGDTVASGTWSTWPDSTGNAHALSPNGTPNTATVNGVQSVQFLGGGTTQYAKAGAGICGASSPVSLATMADPATTADQTVATTFNAAANELALDYLATGHAQASDTNATNLGPTTNTYAGGTGPHFLGGVNNGASSFVQLAGTVKTGPLALPSVSATDFLISSGALPFTGTVQAVVLRCAAESQADMGTEETVLNALFGGT